MVRVVKRAYKYRFYPTAGQAAKLARTFGCVRLVYNKALEERTRAYTLEGRTRLLRGVLGRCSPQWKRSEELGFLNEVSSVPLQQALRHLQGGVHELLRQTRQVPGVQVQEEVAGVGRVHPLARSRYRDGELTLAKMDGPAGHRVVAPAAGGRGTVHGDRDQGRGRALVRVPAVRGRRSAPLAPPRSTVGVDAGITALVTLSTGEKIVNPRHERRDRRTAGQGAAGAGPQGEGVGQPGQGPPARWPACTPGSPTGAGTHLHKLTTRLVRENQTVVIEDLTVRNMVKNRSLARAISDAAWREAIRN